MFLDTSALRIFRAWPRLHLPRKATAVERVVARWGGAPCVPVGESGMPCRRSVTAVVVMLFAMASRLGDGVSRARTMGFDPASAYDLLACLWF